MIYRFKRLVSCVQIKMNRAKKIKNLSDANLVKYK